MPIKNLYKALIFTGAALIILIGAFVYIYLGIQKRNGQSSELLSEIQTESIREAKLKNLKDTVINTAEKRDELSEYILDSEGTVGLIEKIEQIGRSSGSSVSIQSVGIEAIEKQNDYEWLNFTINSVGTWRQVLNLVSIIESLPYRTETDSLVISRDKQKGSVLWQLKVKLKVLKQRSSDEKN